MSVQNTSPTLWGQKEDREVLTGEEGTPSAFWRLLRPHLRTKITIPYVVLAAVLALVGAFVVARLVADSVQEKFRSQLVDSGGLVADGVVKIEREHLATLRTIAHTEGMAETIRDRNAERLRELIFPILVNDRAALMDIVDLTGVGVLAMHHRRGSLIEDYETFKEGDYRNWLLVRQVLANETDSIGDKFAGLVDAPWGLTFYIAGPIKADGRLVGVILVGSYLEEMGKELRELSAAHVTFYQADGSVTATTLEADRLSNLAITPSLYDQILREQQNFTTMRDIEVRGRAYVEAFGAFEARHGKDLAVFSAALPQSLTVKASPVTRLQLVGFIAILFAAVIVVGIFLAGQITRPLLELVRASRQVARGDLTQEVNIQTGDEVGVLANTFNNMVRGLREREFLKDTFGRFVTDEVLEILLRDGVDLGGDIRSVTMIFSDIKGFTSMSERHEPSGIVAFLNEYFTAMVDAINQHDGVVNKYVGDEIIAIFGAPLDQPDHAHHAVLAGLAMQKRLIEVNQERQERGEEPIYAGIGINTGPVVAGCIGSEERMEYTVIGDAVNVTARIEALTREYDQDLIISQSTLDALGPDHDFVIKDLGGAQVKGKSSLIKIYAVLGRKSDSEKEIEGTR